MAALDRGLYELLITEALDAQLNRLGDRLQAVRGGLRAPEAADRIGLHLARVVGQAIAAIDEPERAAIGIDLARRLIDMIRDMPGAAGLAAERPVEAGELLRSIIGRLPDGRSESIAAPLIPLLDTTLLTNAPGEPRVGHQIGAEIHSADRVDVVMAFIRRSGIAPLLEGLQGHCTAGRPLRILTTTYTGSTEARALDELRDAGADIRVSFDTDNTRLHAKAWLFHRNSGFSTAYIGSSNLTHSAQISGLEWNVRVAGARNPDVIDKVAAVFESYWQHPDFQVYDPAEFRARMAIGADARTTLFLSPTELRPEPFQQRLLEQIALSRQQGHHRNLLVAATGTGKTVMAALDYLSLREALPRARLLFVAHREEILAQARRTFRAVLQDPYFGEIWKGTQEPREWNHVFGSVQTLNNRQDEIRSRWPAGDWFAYVVVDEVHHGAAESHRFLFDFLRPKVLLGLTATPERSDGESIAADFHDRFAAEVRLGEGIARERLVPFHYFGIAEGVPDLSTVGWNRGRYDAAQLDSRLAGDVFASVVFSALSRIIGQPTRMRALAFCTGLRQAEFLSGWFGSRGLRSAWVGGETETLERKARIEALAEGDLNILFSVDLFNEGVDIPAIDTVLFLRPTESLTVFLQQLGRGLRLFPGKSLLTVLDFVGRAQKEYDFSHKFRGLLGVTRTDVRRQIKEGYPDLPPGCSLVLERQAEEEILRHIAAQIPSSHRKLLAHVSENRELGFERFLALTGWEPEFLLDRGGLWYQMLDELDGVDQPHPKRESALKDWLFSSVLVTDSPDLVTLFLDALGSTSVTHPGADLITQQWAKNADIVTWGSQQAAWVWFLESSRRADEVRRWLLWHRDRLDARGLEISGLPRLRQFCSYDFKTLAWGQNRATWGKPEVTQGGFVRVFDNSETTRYWNLIVTIRKSEADYSRDTLYRDWALTQTEFQWESPNDWIPNSRSGGRFLTEIQAGVPVYLFVRELKKDRWGRTPPYLFLGPVTLVPDSVVGERPIAMRFRLTSPLPMVHFRVFCQEAVC